MLVFKQPLFYLIMAPMHKICDASNSDIPKRSFKVFPLNKKVKVLDLIRREKMSAEVGKINRTNLLSVKL